MDTLKDEYWGQGGEYLLDPKTGKRKLLQRTEPATLSALTPEVESDAAPAPQKPDSGKN